MVGILGFTGVILIQNVQFIISDSKYTNWQELLKAQFEGEIKGKLEEARANNLSEEALRQIIFSTSNLNSAKALGEDETYLERISGLTVTLQSDS